MKFLQKETLSFRINARVLILTSLLFLLILSIFYLFARNRIEESAQQNAIQLAEITISKIETELRELEMVPEVIGGMMELSPIHPDTLNSILSEVIKRHSNVYGSAIAFEPYYYPDRGLYFGPYAYRDGQETKTMLLGGSDYEYFYMDWYIIPKMIGRPYWTEPYFDEGGGDLLMSTYSVPIYSKNKGDRQFIGVATVDLSLEWLRDLVSDVQIFKTGYAFLISRNGVIVTHPELDYIMNETIFSIATERADSTLWEIGRDMQAGNSNFRQLDIQNEEKRWIYYAPVPASEWSIGVVYPDHEMFAALTNTTWLLIILVTGGLLTLSFLIIQIVNRITAPITEFADSARAIAQGDFSGELPKVTSKDEMLQLHDAFSHLQEELKHYIEDLKETTAAKEKIESELRIARDIQLSMIPHTFPPYPDLPQIDLFAFLRSAREVGGDLYDFFVLDKTKFCFAVGDVSGKGVPASLFMAVTRTLLRTIADTTQSPSEMLNTLNKSLAFNNKANMFVTFFLGILDLETGELKFANAGHNPPLLIKSNGEVELFEVAGGIPLGLFSSYEYPESTITLSAGDKIFGFTDGVNEAENAQEEQFEDERILEYITKFANKNPRELVDAMSVELEDFVQGYVQSDDITMMAVAFNGDVKTEA